MKILIVIANHNHNENAIALRKAFSKVVGDNFVRLVDSGSSIGSDQKPHFDDCQENIFYSGLLNRAYAHASGLSQDTPVLFICSDVEVKDARMLVNRMHEAFSQKQILVWAPSSKGSGHPQMWPRNVNKMTPVSFVEGFCFAARNTLLAGICPIDLNVNYLGWGVDKQFGYLAAMMNGLCVVDHNVEVFHPQETGYSTGEASKQRYDWMKEFHISARCYHALATFPGFRTGLGSQCLAKFSGKWAHLAQCI